MSAVILTSVLTCPHCGFSRQETMPTDACQFFYECTQLSNPAAPQTRRLLRVLLVRLGEVPAGPGTARVLRITASAAGISRAGLRAGSASLRTTRRFRGPIASVRRKRRPVTAVSTRKSDAVPDPEPVHDTGRA